MHVYVLICTLFIYIIILFQVENQIQPLDQVHYSFLVSIFYLFSDSQMDRNPNQATTSKKDYYLSIQLLFIFRIQC